MRAAHEASKRMTNVRIGPSQTVRLKQWEGSAGVQDFCRASRTEEGGGLRIMIATRGLEEVPGLFDAFARERFTFFAGDSCFLSAAPFTTVQNANLSLVLYPTHDFRGCQSRKLCWLALSFRFFNGKVTFVENPLAGFFRSAEKYFVVPDRRLTEICEAVLGNVDKTIEHLVWSLA